MKIDITPLNLVFPKDLNQKISNGEWYTRASEEHFNFPSKQIWSDEGMVTNNGIFKRRHTQSWAQKNPRVGKISRILGTEILGHFIQHNSLNAEQYHHLLQNDLEDILPPAQLNSCWFQKDGAPVHNSMQVREYLSHRLGQRDPRTSLLWTSSCGVLLKT